MKAASCLQLAMEKPPSLSSIGRRLTPILRAIARSFSVIREDGAAIVTSCPNLAREWARYFTPNIAPLGLSARHNENIRILIVFFPQKIVCSGI